MSLWHLRTQALFIPVFLLVCWCMPSHSFADPDTITWARNGLIPFYIQEGPYKGQGISDKLTRFFQAQLPQYEHQMENMNFARFFALAERGELVCNPLLLKTKEREKVLAFSHPYKPAYAHILVSRKPIAYPAGGLFLSQFLKQQVSTPLIIQKKRSYGPVLDKVLQEAIKNKKVQVESFPTKQLYTMMEKGRIAYFLDIENSVSYYNALRTSNIKLYNIPLREDRLDRYGYVACSKTKAGRALINRINLVLSKNKQDPAFRQILESWLAKENLPRFRRFYLSEFLNQNLTQ